MTGAEFLRKLEAALGSLTAEQRQEIVNYFGEYVAEMQDNPEALAELGDPSQVAQELLAGLKEQDILLQVPATHPATVAVEQLLLSFVDMDVELVTGAVEEVTVKVSESLRPLIDIQKEAGQVSIRQTVPVDRRFNFFFSFGRNVYIGQKVQIVLPQGLTGTKMTVVSQSGEVTLRGIEAQELSLELGNGDGLLQELRLEQVSALLKNGDLAVNQCVLEKGQLSLSNGDALLERSQLGQFELDVQNGDVAIHQSQLEETVFRAANGDLVCQQSQVGRLRTYSQNGDISMRDLYVSQEAVLETVSGDVEVALAKGISDLYLTVETVHGDYEVETPSGLVEGEGGSYTWGQESAAVSLQVKTVTGDIVIG